MSPSPPPPDKLADALGFASVALAVPPLAAPGAFARAIGLRPGAKTRLIARAVGVQELGAAAGILALGRPRPTPFLWGRVAGDALHAVMLVHALGGRSRHAGRTAAALGAVVGIGVADAYTAAAFGRDKELKTSMSRGPAGTLSVTTTIRATPDEIRAAWGKADGLPAPDAEQVRFTPAPGDRGTEVRISVSAPPGGNAGRMVAGAVGHDPKSNAKDALRRLKQIVETGEVVRSEGTPDGQRTSRLLKQRPAQSVGGSAS